MLIYTNTFCDKYLFSTPSTYMQGKQFLHNCFVRLKAFLPYIIFLIIIIAISIWINSLPPDSLHTLVLRDVDEDAFQISMHRMRQGRTHLNLIQSFSFGFYAYGRLFWLIPGIIWFPFFLAHNEFAIILIPRLVSTFFAILSIIYIYKTLHLRLSQRQAFGLSCVVLFMAWFWKNIFWFHPDHMMVAWTIIGVYYLAKDNLTYTKNFFRACFFIGLAVASKLTALLFVPIVGLYCLYGIYTKKLSAVSCIKKICIAWGIMIAMFVICNPYVLHPIGFSAIKSQLSIDLLSNATNHGGNPAAVTIQSIYDNVIYPYYIARYLLIVAFLFWLWGSIYEIRHKKSPIVFLSTIWVIGIWTYMITQVHKERQHYYLFPALFVPLLFGAITFVPKKRVQNSFIIIILIVQVCIQVPSMRNQWDYYNTIMQTPQNQSLLTLSQTIEGILKDKKINTLLLPNGLPLDYQKLGISMDNITKMYSEFNESMIIGTKDANRNIFFSIPDIIILPKYLTIFDTTKDTIYKKNVSYPHIQTARDFYHRVVQGEAFTYGKQTYFYTILIENKDVIILQKQLR